MKFAFEGPTFMQPDDPDSNPGASGKIDYDSNSALDDDDHDDDDD